VFSALAEKFDRLSSKGAAIESAVVDLMARVAVSFRPVEGAGAWHRQAGAEVLHHHERMDRSWVLKPVWEALGDGWARMGYGSLSSLELDMLQESRQWSQVARSVLAKAPAGLKILLDGSAESFALAMSRGWIETMSVDKPIKAEHPDFVAWNKRSMESRSNGREIDVSDRMAAAARAIESSTLPMPEKRELLAKCSNKAALESRVDPRKAMTATLKLFERGRISPVALFLAYGNPHEVDGAAKGRALAQAGWNFSEELAQCPELGKLGQAMRSGADHPRTRAWLDAVLEREELSKVALAPKASGSGPLRM
jgi:hypothetical protein